MNKKYYKEGAWWTSPYNFVDEVPAIKNRHIEIHDATLRDGEQTPGVVFSADDKLRIAEKLIEVGVTRIEAGMTAVSKMDYNAICNITKKFPEANIYTFARALRKDIDMAIDSGAKGVVIEVPIGYPKLKYQFDWTWEKVLEKSTDCINYARERGLKTTYFPYDTTRSREEDFGNLINGIMKDCPPDSIGVVDTMGCASPAAIQYLVRKVKKLTNGLTVEVHTHNDFGMAVATELAGVMAGADVVHSCVNGMGERTGNAALEDLILNLQLLMNTDASYNLQALKPLCDLVSNISGIPFAPNKPFSGAKNYMRESGIGVDLVIKQPLAMFATDPAYFGRKAEIALGKKSGKLSIEYNLEQLGLTATDDQISDILLRVKNLSIKEKRLITDAEFKTIIEQVL